MIRGAGASAPAFSFSRSNRLFARDAGREQLRAMTLQNLGFDHRTIVVGLVWNQNGDLMFCRMHPDRGVFPERRVSSTVTRDRRTPRSAVLERASASGDDDRVGL